MPRGSARDLLILSLPALVAIIGALWLKRRRRRRDTHTDPGGTTDNIPNILFKEVNQIDDIITPIIQKEVELILSEEKFVDTAQFAEISSEIFNTNQTIESDSSLFVNTSVDEKIEEISELEEVVSDEEKQEIVSEEEKQEIVSEEKKQEIVSEEEKQEIVSEEIKQEIVSEEEKQVEIYNPETEEKPGLEEGELPSSSENSFQLEEETKMKKVKQGDLAEKLANLELDSMKIRDEKQKENNERDSANHSPSEVMLASPSISNFSDAHSEGSSDSGKGHSDIATSPSRTPAGGSSLAGDLAANFSLYEFVLPQVIVGRLIGKHGAFLHEIRTKTQTNIFIKRHPDTNKLKICAIEGTQQDIDKALAKIRHKFPLRRFPDLTLERVSFVNITNNLPSLRMEDFHVQLVEGVNNDCILSSLISAAHFFLQQPSHPSYGSLSALNQVMNQLYISNEAPGLDAPVKDAICAAPTSGGWYRAQIINVDEENSTSTVRFLDYGGYLILHSSLLRQIRGDLLSIPFQAVECYLANVAPKDENGWSEEAKLFVQSLTLGQILQAQIYDYADDFTPLVYLYTSNGHDVVLVNEELVLRGYGVLINQEE